MQREGADPQDMQVSDFLCDYCGRTWNGAFPMVEGHQGSLICGGCLTVAFAETGLAGTDMAPSGVKCTMCLEEREDAMWASAARDGVYACRRCLKQAAGRLHKDPDWDWTKPALESDA